MKRLKAPEISTEPLQAPDIHLVNEQVTAPKEQDTIAPTARRQALRNIRRQLNDDELAQTGTQKMLLEMLEEVENDRESLRTYVTNFYEADKKAAIFAEKLNANRSIEISFGVGVGLGGTVLGLAPFFWTPDKWQGIICICLGVILIIGASIARAVK